MSDLSKYSTQELKEELKKRKPEKEKWLHKYSTSGNDMYYHSSGASSALEGGIGAVVYANFWSVFNGKSEHHKGRAKDQKTAQKKALEKLKELKYKLSLKGNNEK